jgi:hypothetical protein
MGVIVNTNWFATSLQREPENVNVTLPGETILLLVSSHNRGEVSPYHHAVVRSESSPGKTRITTQWQNTRVQTESSHINTHNCREQNINMFAKEQTSEIPTRVC